MRWPIPQPLQSKEQSATCPTLEERHYLYLGALQVPSTYVSCVSTGIFLPVWSEGEYQNSESLSFGFFPRFMRFFP